MKTFESLICRAIPRLLARTPQQTFEQYSLPTCRSREPTHWMNAIFFGVCPSDGAPLCFPSAFFQGQSGWMTSERSNSCNIASRDPDRNAGSPWRRRLHHFQGLGLPLASISTLKLPASPKSSSLRISFSHPRLCACHGGSKLANTSTHPANDESVWHSLRCRVAARRSRFSTKRIPPKSAIDRAASRPAGLRR